MRNRAKSVAGQAWLKTGSLRDVSAIAGYAQSVGGRRYAVVGIINHDNAGAARAALDALVQWVVQTDAP
jgi:D-alanyl-D-alanine carboxypeptidase/D-alanyl-D-alanine-endopeptidase (penicillin-binding protein 4)